MFYIKITQTHNYSDSNTVLQLLFTSILLHLSIYFVGLQTLPSWLAIISGSSTWSKLNIYRKWWASQYNYSDGHYQLGEKPYSAIYIFVRTKSCCDDVTASIITDILMIIITGCVGGCIMTRLVGDIIDTTEDDTEHGTISDESGDYEWVGSEVRIMSYWKGGLARGVGGKGIPRVSVHNLDGIMESRVTRLLKQQTIRNL